MKDASPNKDILHMKKVGSVLSLLLGIKLVSTSCSIYSLKLRLVGN